MNKQKRQRFKPEEIQITKGFVNGQQVLVRSFRTDVWKPATFVSYNFHHADMIEKQFPYVVKSRLGYIIAKSYCKDLD